MLVVQSADEQVMTDTFNILMSSAGHRLERIHILRESLRQLGLDGRLFATDMSRMAASLYAVDRALIVPPCRDDGFLPATLEICRENNIRLLVPNLDTELPKLAEARKQFADIGTTVLSSSPEVIAIGRDKKQTHHWLTENDFPTVRQTNVETVLAEPEDWPFPLLVKPCRGSSSVGVAIVKNTDELVRQTCDDEYVVQTIARGHEYTVSVLANRAGKCLCAIPRRRIEVRAGEVSKGITVRNDAVIQLARAICDRLPGVYGPINVQIFLDDNTGEMNVIEMNPRFGGGFHLAWEAGGKYPQWIIEEILGLPSTAKDDQWQDGLVMMRYAEAVFVHQADMLS